VVVPSGRSLHRKPSNLPLVVHYSTMLGDAELDFTRLVIRPYRLPEPDRQSRRKDPDGTWRYLDAVWEDARLVVEIDGRQHMDTQQYWDDMNRDNDLQIGGYLVLRFPSWLVRHHPESVADRISKALHRK
jgi:hypothetical protein